MVSSGGSGSLSKGLYATERSGFTEKAADDVHAKTATISTQTMLAAKLRLLGVGYLRNLLGLEFLRFHRRRKRWVVNALLVGPAQDADLGLVEEFHFDVRVFQE